MVSPEFPPETASGPMAFIFSTAGDSLQPLHPRETQQPEGLSREVAAKICRKVFYPDGCAISEISYSIGFNASWNWSRSILLFGLNIWIHDTLISPLRSEKFVIKRHEIPLGSNSCSLYRAINLIQGLSTPKALDLLDRVSLSTLKCDQEAGGLNYPHLLYQRFPPFSDHFRINFFSRFAHKSPTDFFKKIFWIHNFQRPILTFDSNRKGFFPKPPCYAVITRQKILGGLQEGTRYMQSIARLQTEL